MSTPHAYLPVHQAVVGADEGERRAQTGTIAATAADPAFEQVTFIDAGGKQRITLLAERHALRDRARPVIAMLDRIRLDQGA